MANKKAKGPRAKSRQKLSAKGPKATVNRLLQDFDKGQKVIVKINASIHSGFPARRFHGKTGVVEGKQGKACIVSVKDGSKLKRIIAHPVHLMAAAS